MWKPERKKLGTLTGEKLLRFPIKLDAKQAFLGWNPTWSLSWVSLQHFHCWKTSASLSRPAWWKWRILYWLSLLAITSWPLVHASSLQQQDKEWERVLGALWFTNQALIKPEKAAVKIKVTDTVSYGCPDLNWQVLERHSPARHKQLRVSSHLAANLWCKLDLKEIMLNTFFISIITTAHCSSSATSVLWLTDIRKTGFLLHVTSSPVVNEEVAGVQGKVLRARPGQGDGTKEVRCPLEVLDFISQGVHWRKEGEILHGL